MKIPKESRDRLILLSKRIKLIAVSGEGHLPDKISGLQTTVSLINLEIAKLKV